MRFEYVCPDHGSFLSTVRADATPCHACDVVSRRKFSFRIDSSFEAHYSPAFGCVVNSPGHAKSLAAIQSEKQSREQGRDVEFAVVDVHDDAAVGVNRDEKKHAQEMTRKHVVDSMAKGLNPLISAKAPA